ncbi:hypothetical protein [Luteimonas terrae]|uniref:Uncharacterized protein n=1 Tax=Luteimonas terrae TaxID=1530191 RepID=A0ABU1XXA1_9GAMM|nr:hypothetical protein [Luteimonas terrae]MDR7193383.1 hypothetical protein [Luteimonas terrae]
MTTITAVQRMFPELPEAHANPHSAKRLVTGFDVGPFFVHIGLSDDETLSYSNGRHEWDTWHVTHRASGFAVQKKINTHPRAIWLAQQLCALDVWDHDTKPALLAGLSQEQLAIIATLRADAMSGDCQGQLGIASPSAAVSDDGLFYIQDSRSYVGNCPLWWAPKGNGYVTRLDQAGRYTLAEAMAQHRSRDTDVPWPCAEIDAIVRGTVDVQDMRPVSQQSAAFADAPVAPEREVGRG